MWIDLVLLLFLFRSFTCTVRLLLHSFYVFKLCVSSWIIIFGQLHTQEFKATKKQVVRLQLNEKKWKKSQTWLMSLYWKRKPIWKKDLITYSSYPWIMFFWMIGYYLERGVRLKLNVQGQGGERILDIDGQGSWSWKLGNFHGRHICSIPYINAAVSLICVASYQHPAGTYLKLTAIQLSKCKINFLNTKFYKY